VQINLRAEPSGAVAPGDEITYTIEYRPIGSSPLTGVVITNAVPSGTQLITGSIQPAAIGEFDPQNQIVRWNLGNLGPGAAGGAVSYKVVANRDCKKLATMITPFGFGQVALEPPFNCGVDRYRPGTEVTLRAEPAADKTFARWSGAIVTTTNPITITMDRDRTITAEFKDTCYSLTKSVTPTGGGTLTAAPLANCPNTGERTKYLINTGVTLVVTPTAHYAFINWTGDVSGTLTQTIVTMDRDRSATAVLTPCVSLVTPVIPGATAGSVVRDPLPNCRGGVRYVPDTVVSLAANPKTDYAFRDWSGDIISTTNPVTVTLSTTRTVTATFQSCVPVTAVADPRAGGRAFSNTLPNCPGGGTNYEPASMVAISATRNSDYAFAHWSVAGTDAAIADTLAQTTTLIVGTTATTATAHFTTCKTLTTPVNPAGSGLVTAEPPPNCDGVRYLPGTAVTLTANAAIGYEFVNWTGAASGMQTTTTVFMNNDVVATANFRVSCFFLKTLVNPLGSGNVNEDPDPNAFCPYDLLRYRYGVVIPLEAVAKSGHAFKDWTGADSNTNPTTVTMTADKLVTANFQSCLPLTITRLPNEAAGTVARDPIPDCASGDTYRPGTVVTLTATALNDFTFKEWSGDASGRVPTTTVTMNVIRTVNANFQECVTITLVSAPSDQADFTQDDPNCTGGARYLPGVPVAIAVQPKSGYNFQNWTAPSGSFSHPNRWFTNFTPGENGVTVTAHLSAWTPTPTNTPTNTPTATDTPTPTSTPTATNTPTATATPTSTYTPTSEPTNTPTSTSTNTPTATSTPTPTNTPTATSTPTNIPTDTPAPTDTATPTQTATSTSTPTVTDTPVSKSTVTPTATPTGTLAWTPTHTSTPTVTATPTPTKTPGGSLFSGIIVAAPEAAAFGLSAPMAGAQTVVINKGAYVSWRANGQPGSAHTGWIINGPHIFLPLILR